MLPFGGFHADVPENLVKFVPRRLTNKLRLARDLDVGQRPIWAQDPAALYAATTIPVDLEQIVALFAMVGPATSALGMTLARSCWRRLGSSSSIGSSR